VHSRRPCDLRCSQRYQTLEISCRSNHGLTIPAHLRSNLGWDVFGEQFSLPAEAEYGCVVATVDVRFHRLRVRLGEDLITDFPYQLR
jgi:hypothetical protein